jgi:hypothetical protein
VAFLGEIIDHLSTANMAETRHDSNTDMTSNPRQTRLSECRRKKEYPDVEEKHNKGNRPKGALEHKIFGSE